MPSHADEAWNSIPGLQNPPSFEVGLRFPGQYYDEESGLHYNWHRYYDPNTGRYLQVEPIVSNPPAVLWYMRHGVHLNPYAYAVNSTFYYTDRNGLYPLGGFPQENPPGSNPGEVYYQVRDEHWGRNRYNQDVPYRTAKEFWEKKSDNESIYHRHGPGNESNEKYISQCGHFENVYRDGQIVKDPANVGTYNVSPPRGFWGKLGHFIVDVIPYYLWGNTSDDPTPAWNRVTGP